MDEKDRHSDKETFGLNIL